MLTPKQKSAAAGPKRPVRVPANLGYALVIGFVCLLLQVAILWHPAKQHDVPLPPATPTSAPQLSKTLSVSRNSAGTPVEPGEELTFTLKATNALATAQTAAVSMNASDLLQYASITDLSGATIDNNAIIWPNQTIQPGDTVEHQFTIRVHDIPSIQSRSLTTPDSYDMIIHTQYGSIIDLPLDKPVIKQVEATVMELPRLPAAASISITLFILGAVWLVRRQAQHGKLVGRLPGYLAIGGLSGSATILLLSWMAGMRSGFALSGSESIVGGLLGTVVAYAVYLINRAFAPRPQ